MEMVSRMIKMDFIGTSIAIAALLLSMAACSSSERKPVALVCADGEKMGDNGTCVKAAEGVDPLAGGYDPTTTDDQSGWPPADTEADPTAIDSSTDPATTNNTQPPITVPSSVTPPASTTPTTPTTPSTNTSTNPVTPSTQAASKPEVKIKLMLEGGKPDAEVNFVSTRNVSEVKYEFGNDVKVTSAKAAEGWVLDALKLPVTITFKLSGKLCTVNGTAAATETSYKNYDCK